MKGLLFALDHPSTSSVCRCQWQLVNTCIPAGIKIVLFSMLWMEKDTRWAFYVRGQRRPLISLMHSFIFWAFFLFFPNPRNDEKVFSRPIDLVPLFGILAFKFLFLFFILTGHIEEDRSLNSLWPRPTDGKCQYNRWCRPITIYIAGYYRQIPPGQIPESLPAAPAAQCHQT